MIKIRYIHQNPFTDAYCTGDGVHDGSKERSKTVLGLHLADTDEVNINRAGLKARGRTTCGVYVGMVCAVCVRRRGFDRATRALKEY